MEGKSNKKFSYAEHLDVIKSIRRQLKDSDERFERSLSTDTRRRKLFSKSNSFSSQALRTANSLCQDEPLLFEGVDLLNSDRSRENGRKKIYSTFQDAMQQEETKTEELEIESSFEYLKSIRKTEMFKTDKERIEFLVSEIEILNKRIMILECEIECLRKEKEELKTQGRVTPIMYSKAGQEGSREKKLEMELEAAKKLMMKMLNTTEDASYVKALEEKVEMHKQEIAKTKETHSKEVSKAKKALEEVKKKEICVELQNNLLNEKVKMLQEKLDAAENEKVTMQVRIDRQNQIIAQQAKTLERFKKEVIEKYVHN